MTLLGILIGLFILVILYITFYDDSFYDDDNDYSSSTIKGTKTTEEVKAQPTVESVKTGKPKFDKAYVEKQLKSVPGAIEKSKEAVTDKPVVIKKPRVRKPKVKKEE